MDAKGTTNDHVMASLIEMGFENLAVTEAMKVAGTSVNDAIEFILKGSCNNSRGESSSSKCSTINGKALGKRALSSSHHLGQMRQSSITEHLQTKGRSKRSRTDIVDDMSVSKSEVSPVLKEEYIEPLLDLDRDLKTSSRSFPVDCPEELHSRSDWELRVNSLLQKHFRISSLKRFQKEALAAWLAKRDCLVLAATGSGKSMCFQIPALLTGKVVVVISPLISLMHDQCFKLAKHGVSACFLGSGQPDSSVEKKAMSGMYDIIYVCPETIFRLITPLQMLAKSRGIALFAIDEVHCISKWGHDFRPDYRRLSALRENFSVCNLEFLKFDIPLMALTATATMHVREDIIDSLCMSKETKIVLTSFFRSNLRFSVRNSRTTSPSSYAMDFHELIDTYAKNKSNGKKTIISQDLEDASENSSKSASCSIYEVDSMSPIDRRCDEKDDEVNSMNENGSTALKGKKMSVEYLEDEVDVFQSVDDWDVDCGEFWGQSPSEPGDICGPSNTIASPNIPEERLKCLQGPIEHGPTIIYAPTRKETVKIAEYLCSFGVKAAAYHAKLPKSHLRQVHKKFHEDTIEVVVATIAFGMGIDKLNVRRIIHYGWPQSLEAYYQEAGRAGRDGKLADCILYADLSRIPTLLPSQRSEEQQKVAYKMLSDCFRYGMSTSSCRSKTLVEYFGEDFSGQKCLLCDVCVNGPPEMHNLKEEADIFMQVVAGSCGQSSFEGGSYDDVIPSRPIFKPNLRMLVSKIREQSQKFMATDLLWWQGFARIMEGKGYIKEREDKARVQIKFPEATKLGLDFLQSIRDQVFFVYPEADMLLSTRIRKSYSTFSEWGRGWADPEIRRQRLSRKHSNRKSRKRLGTRNPNMITVKPNSRSVRGRLAEKLSKKKR